MENEDLNQKAAQISALHFPVDESELSCNQQEILRSYERTFSEAYWRTSLSLFTTAAVFLKIFSTEFHTIGFLYLGLGVAFVLISIWRSLDKAVETVIDSTIPFKTHGDIIFVSFLATLTAFVFSLFFVLFI